MSGAQLTAPCVLVIDDNAGFLHTVREFLKMHGFQVKTAYDGAAGLALYQADPEAYAAIVLDIQMPVMDGYEMLRRVRALPCNEARRIPVVVMTGNSADSARLDCDRMLFKPFMLDALLTAVRSII